MIGLVAVDGPGRPLADELHARWPEGSHVHRASRGTCSQPPDVLHVALRRYRHVVAIAPLPAVVSLLTGGLVDLPRDTALVCVDPGRRWVVPMAGGDAAEELSVEVAAALGVTPVPTGHRPDRAPGKAAGHVPTVPTGPPGEAPVLRITDREAPGEGDLLVLPRTLVVGIGAGSAAGETEAMRLLTAALDQAGLPRAAVARLATVTGKADHPAVRWAAFCLGGVPVDEHPAESLAGVPVPNPSTRVGTAVGTASVAEAAALASAPGGRLVVAKRTSARATVAIARAALPGRLTLVDLGSAGPGRLVRRAPAEPPTGPTGPTEPAEPAALRAVLRAASAVVGTPEAVEAAEALAGPLRPTTRRIAVDVPTVPAPDRPDAATPAPGTATDGTGAPLDPAGAAAHLAAHGHDVALVTVGDNDRDTNAGDSAGAGPAVPPGPSRLHRTTPPTAPTHHRGDPA
ncbi:cobalamin biosynthesis protein [Kitasatospora sp. NPDC093550]|uniref:cobalamin biosynthesis protein n=1 Tax=Kitasatospora sp. NPDC093550 TaxID=3364089 RepID=UPI0038284565